MLLDINRNYFTEEDLKIRLNTKRCEIYVPDAYIDSKLFNQDGDIYDLLFMVKYRLIHADGSDISKLPLYDFHIPTMILTKPDEIKHEELDIYGSREKITTLIYYKGGEIIYGRNIIKSSIMVERFVTLLINGKIRVSYSKANDILNKVQKIHGIKLNIPQYVQHILLSEVFRSKKDLSIPARLIATASSKSDDEIVGLNMRENAAFTSTLAGVGFEDIKSMLTVADNRDDKNDTYVSNIEYAIKGRIPPKT